jgi:hypothetical protein
MEKTTVILTLGGVKVAVDVPAPPPPPEPPTDEERAEMVRSWKDNHPD